MEEIGILLISSKVVGVLDLIGLRRLRSKRIREDFLLKVIVSKLLIYG